MYDDEKMVSEETQYGQVHSQLVALHDTYEALQNYVNELEERLSSVLTPELKQARDEVEKAQELVPLAGELRNINSVFRSMISRIDNLQKRIQL